MMIDRPRRWVGAALLAGALLQLGCAAAPAPAAAPTVKSGSMARFIGHQGYLYALNAYELLIYRVVPGTSPSRIGSQDVPAEAETLFPHEGLLFLGTRQGMLVYSLEDPAAPKLMGEAAHLVSCDPVVVQDGVAYVTLRSGSACRRGANVLLVFDVANPTEPRQIAEHPMSSPHGLAVDGSVLFVADAKDGLIVLDVREPTRPRLLGKVPDIAGYDVIAHAGTLYVSADDGLYQYAYGPEGITQAQPLSRIPIGSEPASGGTDAVLATEPPAAPPAGESK